MSSFLTLLLGCFLCLRAWSSVGYVTGEEVFLKGYDPTAYFTHNKAIKGKPDFSYTYDGVKIHFQSSEALKRFKKNPEKYMPEYKGWCAYALAHGGDLVEIDPKSFKMIDGKLYLFYDSWGFWADTLKKWNKKNNDDKQVKEAEKNWKKQLKKNP